MELIFLYIIIYTCRCGCDWSTSLKPSWAGMFDVFLSQVYIYIYTVSYLAGILLNCSTNQPPNREWQFLKTMIKQRLVLISRVFIAKFVTCDWRFYFLSITLFTITIFLKLLARLLASKHPDDLQAANRLIKNMVRQVWFWNRIETL